jgi:acetyl-CoA synthetase
MDFSDLNSSIKNLSPWVPTSQEIAATHISQLMAALQINSIEAFHRFSSENYTDFWHEMIKRLGIVFKTPPSTLVDLQKGVESPIWLPGAKMNIADSCFQAPSHATAIVYPCQGELKILTFAELNTLSNRIANGLQQAGMKPQDTIAIAMPMTPFAIAIYLGIIKMGGTVVSIADSFSAEEIALRLTIAKASFIFTQDMTWWAGKKIPLYEKVKEAKAERIVVVPQHPDELITLRSQDLSWQVFLSQKENFTSVACDPMAPCNILFSSGTTGTPKAIVWSHSTPIKAASDAWLHHDIHPTDTLCWPTNLGWMMGPWLVFAAFINQAAIAVYPDAPRDRQFGKFVEQAKVTMLGVVPTLVASWHQSHCMENLNWSAIKKFSSTGECSNPNDMHYLMSLAGHKPVIEYCGGTEVGGAYLSSTMIQPNYPAFFSTKVMGIDFVILDESGNETDDGEVALIPPSFGLSTTLLNADHHQTYYANMPKHTSGKILRRHGDHIKRFANGYYAIYGRLDDTMNLGGIKTSSAEIERAIAGIDPIIETAAIAVPPPNNGPSLLVIYAVSAQPIDKEAVKKAMQMRINQQLNPLFKIHDLVMTQTLPKTASNKIMRRVLRADYAKMLT